jgi:UPF0755 protein
MSKPIIAILSYSLWGIVSLIIIAVSLVMVERFTRNAFDFGFEYFAQAELDYAEDILIVIPENPTIDDVADVLFENGIIRNRTLFVLESRLNGTENIFRGGEFVVNPAMRYDALVDSLTSREFVILGTRRITIREGFTLSDIGEYLESMEIVTKAEFIEAANDPKWREAYNFLVDVPDRPNYLEGYLFPDTYFINENADSDEIIINMLNAFNSNFGVVFRNRAATLGLTIDEVVIIASMIEREIRVPSERALCSAVIHNRLRANRPLQIDATIIYALGIHQSRLFYVDLEVDSPYNTYTRVGLPIGPISNPGRACLEAALYPADVNYVYYVVSNLQTGEHFFTSSESAFFQARDRYRRMLNEAAN